MFTTLVRSLRCVAVGTSASLILLSSFGSLQAQVAAAPDAMVQTANARLTAEAQSGLPLTTQTRSMLVTRHSTLVSVFTDSPSTALSYALPAVTREKLLNENPSYAALIEQEKTVTGRLTVAIEDSFKNHSSRKVYSLHMAMGATRLSFVTAPANLSAMEGRTVTVTGLGFPEIVVVDSVRPATRAEAESSAKEAAATSRLSANAIRTNATPPFTGPGITTTAPAAAISTGPQSAAVIIVDFAVTPMDTNGNPASSAPLTLQGDFNTQAYYNKILNPGSIPNVSDYIAETSYGKASYAADVYGPFVLPNGYSCSGQDGLIAAALQAAVNAGLDTSKYNRFVFPFPSTACTFDGLASSGPNTPLINHEWSWVTFPIQPAETNTTASFAQKFLVMSHEFGHNLGMGHSNTLDFGATSLGPIDFVATNPGTVDPGGPSHPAALEGTTTIAATGTPITGINDEYGDPYPVMAGVGYTPYNAEHRFGIMGWIGTDGERDVTSSGNFSVTPTENTTGLRALHVLRDAASDSWVWVEFHQPNSVYTTFGNQYNVMPNTLTTGAELLYSTSTLEPLHTYLIDTTPSGKPNNFADATLANGLSWSDPYSLLTITAGSQTNSALGVTVSYDTACATPSFTSTVLGAAAGTGTVTVTAAAGCAWAVSSNTPWISLPGVLSGKGSGKFSFTYATNTTASQRSGYITTARQSTPLLQQGTGINIVGISPVSTQVAPGVFTPLTFSVNNLPAGSDGSIFFVINSISPVRALSSCGVGAQIYGDNTGGAIFDTSTGANYPIGVAGASPAVIGACTFDVANSSITLAGTNATVKMSVSFPAASFGNHRISVSNDINNITNNVGYINVGPTVAVLTDATSLSANPSSINVEQSTSLTATVTPALAGSVSFTSGTNVLGSCALTNSTCSITVAGTALQIGSNSIIATFGGINGYPASMSTPATVTVGNAVTTSTVTLTATPASPIPARTVVALSATVTATAGSAPLTSGIVNFYDGSISSTTLLGMARSMPQA